MLLLGALTKKSVPRPISQGTLACKNRLQRFLHFYETTPAFAFVIGNDHFVASGW